MPRATRSVLVLLALFAFTLASGPSWAEDPPAPAATRTVDLENATCPVSGKPVVTGVTATVAGTVVHFCCTECAAKYQANPSKYETALRSDPAVARKLDMAHGAVPAEPASFVEAPSAKETEFRDAMRRLWEDHVVWTRLFIISATGNLPDKDAVTNRLLKNQADMGEGIKPFYGDEAATKLTALLKDHILIAADVVGAAAAGDATKAEAAKAKWVANSDEIATLLSTANPTAWPLEATKSMMREHLDLTTAEATARIQKDWDADIAAYEKVREQAEKMADMLSDGIRRQFPQKFK